HPLIAVRIDHAGADPAAPLQSGFHADFSFRLSDYPGALLLDASAGDGQRVARPVLASELAFNPADGFLYVVDAANRGLMQVDLDPFALVRAFE
ncbi:MAG: hypothetical protein ACPGUV_15215, partial [Polyangiales bacterium]